MANNKIQVKRTSTTGRTPNTTNVANAQYIDAGELALNMADGILYSSNGSALIEIGANNVNALVSNTLTLGNSSVNATINSTTYSGTANNATNLNGVAAASYVQNTDSRTLSGNLIISGTYFNPSANGILLGNADARWNVYTMGIDARGTITAFSGFTSSGGASLQGFINTTSGMFINGTTQNVQVGSLTTGSIILGGTTQTGSITLGRSTANQTVSIANGATTSGNVKVINIGTEGLAGSQTNITIGSSLSNTLITVNSNNTNFSGTLTVNAISANGGVGTSGQVLKSNGTATYWATDNADVGAANQILYRNSSNALTSSSGLVYDGTSIKVNGNLESVYQNGNEGGEIFLNAPAPANTSIAGTGVTIDIFQNRLRFFEQGGNNRGAYIDITAAANGVGSNLLTGGGGGTVTSVGSGDGLTGGPITGSGTLSVLANTGIIANTTGLFVNSAYIGTLSANNSSFLNGKAESALNVNSALTANSSSFLGSKQEAELNVNSALTSNNATNLGGVAAASYVQNTDSRTLSGNLYFTGANVYFDSSLFVGANTTVNTSIIQSNNITSLGGVIRAGSDASNTIIANSALTSGSNAQRAINLIGTDAIQKIVRTANGNPAVELQQRDGGVVKGFYDLVVINDAFVIRDRTTGSNLTRVQITSGGDVGIGNTTPTHKLRVEGTSSLAGAVSDVTTLSAGNTTITGFANVSVSVNSALLTVGTSFIANTTGAYHTGVVNAASHTTTGVTINATAVALATSAGIYANGSLGTAGHVLTSNATTVYWAAAAGGGYYKGGTAAVGTLAAGGQNIFRVNANTLNTNTTFVAGENGSAAGPIAISSGVILTIESGARVAIV